MRPRIATNYTPNLIDCSPMGLELHRNVDSSPFGQVLMLIGRLYQFVNQKITQLDEFFELLLIVCIAYNNSQIFLPPCLEV